MLRLLTMALFILGPLYPVDAQAQDENTVWLAGASWYPYIFTDTEGNPAGSDYQILAEVMAQLHYRLGVRAFPERRLHMRILKGNVDIVLGAAKNADRAKNNFFSDPYRKETIAYAFVAANREAFSGKSLKALLDEGRLVALNKGGWYGDWFNNEIMASYPDQLVHVDSLERRLHLLTMKRVDLIVDDRHALLANAQLQHIDNLVVSPHHIAQQDVHFMFSKHVFDQAFVNDFNQALASTLQQM